MQEPDMIRLWLQLVKRSAIKTQILLSGKWSCSARVAGFWFGVRFMAFVQCFLSFSHSFVFFTLYPKRLWGGGWSLSQLTLGEGRVHLDTSNSGSSSVNPTTPPHLSVGRHHPVQLRPDHRQLLAPCALTEGTKRLTYTLIVHAHFQELGVWN